MLLHKFYRDRKKPSEIGSVIANLNYVLNTKKGFGFWREGFGIGDYNEYKARAKIVQTGFEVPQAIGFFQDVRERTCVFKGDVPNRRREFHRAILPRA